MRQRKSARGTGNKPSLFRQLRILVLLFILFLVAASTWLTRLRTTDWDQPLTVALYPINADGSRVTEDYIQDLSLERFEDIEQFFHDEAAHYGLALKEPFELVMGPTLRELPPAPPQDRNLPGTALWSLKIRYWAWQVGRRDDLRADIQLFILYHDPRLSPRVAHSLGLQKGLLGVVNAFATRDQAGTNRVVIAHELLHTLGATDKYDPATNLPRYPWGFAEPDKTPLYPQTFAEIMAGRIPRDATHAEQAENLRFVLVGEATALEIRWIDKLSTPQ